MVHLADLIAALSRQKSNRMKRSSLHKHLFDSLHTPQSPGNSGINICATTGTDSPDLTFTFGSFPDAGTKVVPVAPSREDVRYRPTKEDRPKRASHVRSVKQLISLSLGGWGIGTAIILEVVQVAQLRHVIWTQNKDLSLNAVPSVAVVLMTERPARTEVGELPDPHFNMYQVGCYLWLHGYAARRRS